MRDDRTRIDTDVGAGSAREQLMTFYNTYKKCKNFDIDSFFSNVSEEDIKKALLSENPGIEQFLALISPKAEGCLEDIAQKAHSRTLQYFGRTVQLYTPMYLSNYCVNRCVYCGFNLTNNVERRRLSLDEVKKEAEFIASTGLRHILILTGESRQDSPVSYIKDCIRILREYFSSVSIEIYPLTGDEYEELIAEGVDGLTVYQEVYDEKIYAEVHKKGPKRDYLYRLEAPERALNKGMRVVNIGALLGLAEWRREAFFMALHAKYLQDKFADAEISVSVPRVRPHTGDYKPACVVTDKNIAQIILALRVFLLRVGVTVSTREDAAFRENILPLGVTRISAGSSTMVGGHTVKYTENNRSEQFKIFDERNVDEIKKMLLAKGYQPVLKDWVGAGLVPARK